MKKQQLAFLLYNNRSGSTYLASLLASIQGVGVSIESAFIARLIEREGFVKNCSDLEALTDYIYSEPQFREWNISRETLRAAFHELSMPLSLDEIIRKILSLYFNDHSISYFVYKGPRIILHMDRLQQIIESVKFIHIVRDPRGVINSQLQAKNAGEINTPMATDPFREAWRWSRLVNKIHTGQKENVLEVRYEDLIAEPEKVMTGVCNFLQTDGLCPLSYIHQKPAKEYYDRIPDSQKHLHQNVQSSQPLRNRIEAWNKELPDTDIYLIQKTASTQMKRLGYSFVELDSSACSWSKILKRLLQTRLRATKYALRRYGKYFKNFDQLRERILIKYYEYR